MRAIARVRADAEQSRERADGEQSRERADGLHGFEPEEGRAYLSRRALTRARSRDEDDHAVESQGPTTS